eukprot:jgi/Mesen1/536/ME000104S10619
MESPYSRSLSVARSQIFVDIAAPLEELHATVKTLCTELVPGWAGLPADSLEVSKVTGGITNMLLLVARKGDAQGSCEGDTWRVTVRIFGPNTDVVIDRKREWQAIKLLSAAGFGAQLIGAFQNGAVQSFIDARTLEPRDMGKPEIMPLIASAVRAFHGVEVPGSKASQLWPVIHQFLKLGKELHFDDPAKQERFQSIDLRKIHAEIEELQLYIIDYEYGAYSYRGYDLGNHFNEYSGFECDYSLQGSPASEEELEQLYVETNAYALASHLYWGIWGLVQAKHSPIDFDYLGYFFLRYDEFKRRKDECLRPLTNGKVVIEAVNA